MSDRPFSQETAAAVRRYLGAFLSGSAASDGMHDVVTDVQYWGDTEHLEVLRITHGVLGVRARIAEDVEFLTLVDELGLSVDDAVTVMELDEPPAGVLDLLGELAPAPVEETPEPEVAPAASAASPSPAASVPLVPEQELLPAAEPDPAPAPEPDPEPEPEPDPAPEPEPDPAPEPEPEPAPEPVADDDAQTDVAPVVSIDTSIDDEVELVDKAELPRPTEKEGRRSRRERRRLAAQEAEEHARRAKEAEQAERLARMEASTAPSTGDVTIIDPVDTPAPTGEAHVRIADGPAVEATPPTDDDLPEVAAVAAEDTRSDSAAVPVEHTEVIDTDDTDDIDDDDDGDDDAGVEVVGGTAGGPEAPAAPVPGEEADDAATAPIFGAPSDTATDPEADAQDEPAVDVAPREDAGTDETSDGDAGGVSERDDDEIDLDAPPPLGAGLFVIAMAIIAALVATVLLFLG